MRATSTSSSVLDRASKMLLIKHKARLGWLQGAEMCILGMLLQGLHLYAQKPIVPLGPSSTLPGAGQGTVLDRVVAVVNDDLILESDVDEEQRFEEIQPYRNADGNHSRERTVRRLIDRALILQQEMEPETAISDKELDT